MYNILCVLASGGYPGSYQKGVPIHGLGEVCDAIAFHAGTLKRDGGFVTNGGRVLGITALGMSIEESRQIAYREAKKIHFDGVQYRKDIGIK